jgi:hypothetical protein
MINQTPNPVITLALFVFVLFIAFCIWAAFKLREALRKMGEILAKQSEQPDPDPGNPHEDTKANRDADPR